mgnify:FL=1
MQRTILLNLVKNQKNGDGPGGRKRGTVLKGEKRDNLWKRKRDGSKNHPSWLSYGVVYDLLELDKSKSVMASAGNKKFVRFERATQAIPHDINSVSLADSIDFLQQLGFISRFPINADTKKMLAGSQQLFRLFAEDVVLVFPFVARASMARRPFFSTLKNQQFIRHFFFDLLKFCGWIRVSKNKRSLLNAFTKVSITYYVKYVKIKRKKFKFFFNRMI